MKQKILRILSCAITICMTVCILAKLTVLTEKKDSYEKNAEFLNQKEEFDVLFLGTSHVINGIFPMELWNDYGIVSYNLGGHSTLIPTTYWILQNALLRTTPKVVVVDCAHLSYMSKTSSNFSYLHLSLDSMPLTPTKVRAVMDLLDDPTMEERIRTGDVSEEGEERTMIGLLWDYSVYHSRWSALEKDDFKPSINVEKGAESRIAVTAPAESPKVTKDTKMESETTSVKYLRKIIEDCKSRGIDVVLTYLPFPASEKKQKEANYVYDIAKEYNVGYLNYLDQQVVDFSTDLYDDSSHLNPSGARKVTANLGEYLISHYDIPDRRTDEKYQSWFKDYKRYTVFKNKNLKNIKSLQEYLMLLAGDDVEIQIKIKDQAILNNTLISKLLENLGVDSSLITANTGSIKVTNIGKDVDVLDGPIKEALWDPDAGLQIDVYRNEKLIDSVCSSNVISEGSEYETPIPLMRESDKTNPEYGR